MGLIDRMVPYFCSILYLIFYDYAYIYNALVYMQLLHGGAVPY